MTTTQHLLAVTWTDAEGLLDRVVGMLRRRQVRVHSLAVGRALQEGCSRLTVIIESEAAAADRLVHLYRNVIGVRTVASLPVDQTIVRELALVTLTPSAGERAECLDTLALFGANLLDDANDQIVAELRGDPVFVLSCLRAVERFGIRDVSRTGAAALPRPISAPVLTLQPPQGASA